MNKKNAGKVPQGIAREYQPNQPPGKLTHPRLTPAASNPLPTHLANAIKTFADKDHFCSLTNQQSYQREQAERPLPRASRAVELSVELIKSKSSCRSAVRCHEGLFAPRPHCIATANAVYECCGFGYTLHEQLSQVGARSLITTPMRLNLEGRRKNDRMATSRHACKP